MCETRKGVRLGVALLALIVSLSACTFVEKLMGTDNQAPVAPAGGLELVSISRSEATLRWKGATDDITDSADIEYLLVSSTDPGKLAGADTALKAAPANPSWTRELSGTIGIAAGTLTWFTVLARDEQGNMGLYEAKSATSPVWHGCLAPGYGNAGECSPSDIKVGAKAELFDLLPLKGDGFAAIGCFGQAGIFCSLLDASGSLLASTSSLSPTVSPNIFNLPGEGFLDEGPGKPACGVALPDGSVVAASKAFYIDETNSDWGKLHSESILFCRVKPSGGIDPGYGLDQKEERSYLSEGASLIDSFVSGAFTNRLGDMILVEEGSSRYVYISGHSADENGHQIAAGSGAKDWGLIRLKAEDGSLDQGFGAGGFKATGLKGADIALQGSTSLIIVGQRWDDASNKLVIGRFDLNGNLDGSFGESGYRELGLASVEGLAIGASGEIYVSGSILEGNVERPAIVKLDASGSPATAFGIGGLALPSGSEIEEGGRAGNLALDGQGGILVIGTRAGETGYSYWRDQPYLLQRLFVAKLDAVSGKLFSEGPGEFAMDGIFLPPPPYSILYRGGPTWGMDILVRSDGKILAGCREKQYYQYGEEGPIRVMSFLLEP